ncbi:antitoxin MazE family protein [Ferriphaselus sp. R-1]|uniref:antitoxin MazE family protein n=1 Tax=Ferriphaselus sp. R-1 TaxID=1485544 RepID=UPI000551008A|nr:antitoxin MazE family protein [Ferriphaselus sp. R-1]
MRSTTVEKNSTSVRVQKHRAGLREAGLRPVQIWVPDTRRAGFAEECRRQSLLLQDDAHELASITWLETASDREGWQ